MRQIEVYDTYLEDIDVINQVIKFKVSCSKGTYIRSLCEDIAEALGEIRIYEQFKKIKSTEDLALMKQ